MKLLAVGIVCLGVAASALLLARVEEAAQSTPDFTGGSAAVFVNPQPAGAMVSGVGTNNFTWGTGSSRLRFAGTGFSGVFGEVFPLGTLTYFNATSMGGNANTVDFRLTLALTAPASLSQAFTQSFSLINTPNIDGDPRGSADLVFLPANFPDVVFDLGGVSYTLNFIGFGTVTGSGRVEGLTRFHVLEGEAASAQLLGSITQACVLEKADPIREKLAGLPNCGTSTLGPMTLTWGRFGGQSVLEADSGDKLSLRCDRYYAVRAAYQLYYTRAGGTPLRVGLCPFQGGCNTAEFYHSGDKNKNGKPDCFIKTMWNSADYDVDDTINAWTSSLEPWENLLDWAVSIYNVNSNMLDKKSYKWEYAVGPPVPFSSCGDPKAPIPTGALIKMSSVDPPLGPETEAFFDEVLRQLALQPASSVPMGASRAKSCDFDGDADCDSGDRSRFESSFATCERQPGYSPRADIDQSGCVDARDRRYLFLNDEDGDGLSDAGDNCPGAANPGQADWNANGVGDLCDGSGIPGDLDNDRDVDRDDLTILLAARNTMALGHTDLRDLDGDGRITALDGRKLTVLCTRPGCAVR